MDGLSQKAPEAGRVSATRLRIENGKRSPLSTRYSADRCDPSRQSTTGRSNASSPRFARLRAGDQRGWESPIRPWTAPFLVVTSVAGLRRSVWNHHPIVGRVAIHPLGHNPPPPGNLLRRNEFHSERPQKNRTAFKTGPDDPVPKPFAVTSFADAGAGLGQPGWTRNRSGSGGGAD